MIKKLFLILLLIPSFAQADRVRLLEDPTEALQARIDMIQSAESEIIVEYFSIWEDDVSYGIFSLLLYAARRGVQVKIIVDAFANKLPSSLFSALLEHAKDNNGNVNMQIRVYNPLSINLRKISHRNHSKLIIVDGKQMITGGRNLAAKYFDLDPKKLFNDLDIIVDGQSVMSAREDFMAVFSSEIVKNPVRDYNMPSVVAKRSCVRSTHRETKRCERRQNYIMRKYNEALDNIESVLSDFLKNPDHPRINSIAQPLAKDWLADVDYGSQITFSSHKPNKLVSRSTAYLTDDLMDWVLGAKREVYIVTPYLITTPVLLDLFSELIARGVHIKVITNSSNSTNTLLAQSGYLLDRQKLIAMGIELYEFEGPDTSHGKGAIIDNNKVFIGTFNLDPRSAFINREVGLFIDSSPNNHLAIGAREAFDRLKERSLLVGLNGEEQNLEIQKQRHLELSRRERLSLRILKKIAPLIKNQL